MLRKKEQQLKRTDMLEPRMENEETGDDVEPTHARVTGAPL